MPESNLDIDEREKRTRSHRFALIPAGEFLMGSETGDDNEKPVHRVIISRRFELGKYPVTREQWIAVMGNDPSYFNRGTPQDEKLTVKEPPIANLPVENVAWEGVQDFIKKLNARKDGYSYRLPTEAEWEYACRAGTTSEYAGNLNEMAWYYGNSLMTIHPVGQQKPNAWGLYDMHGNVWEWCQDWYGRDYYKQSPSADPAGPTTGVGRVARGGGWFFFARFCRSAYRYECTPDFGYRFLGFRLLRTYS